tara:strand:- start:61 stop:996 length:936 start_codon:yes stop_codon:yes gene_type:complete
MTIPANVHFSREKIDKEKALQYLDTNFKQNRQLRPRTIDNLVDDIINNNFHLGWDCIAFNEKGELVNGQHRLKAVAEADAVCDFFVLRNIPHKTVRHFDQGSKRTQADRISLSGIKISRKACKVIKVSLMAYNDADSNRLKHAETYSYKRYDSIVSYQYSKHSEFFERLEDDGYFGNSFTDMYVVGAFKIFTEMKVGKKYHATTKDCEHIRCMTPYQRATYWLDLCIKGKSKDYQIDYNADQASFNLKEALVTRKQAGYNMYGLNCRKLYIIAAHYFMTGKATKVRLINRNQDPFSDLQSLPSTNENGNSR